MLYNTLASEKEQTCISSSCQFPLSNMFRLNTVLFYSLAVFRKFSKFSLNSLHYLSVCSRPKKRVHGHKYLEFLNYFCIDDIFHSDTLISTGGNFCQFSMNCIWKIRASFRRKSNCKHQLLPNSSLYVAVDL